MPTKIINASAGSGKTYRLAVAYLQALLTPLPDGTPTPPSQVLATTFTRAAASEILERMLRRLATAVVSAEDRGRLLAEIGRPELGREDLAALLASVCQSLPQLQIGTIDALFARIVRVMGLDLGFPPAWTVADDTRADELALEAADRLLHGPGSADPLGAWRRYARFRPILRVRQALVDLLEDNRFTLLDAPAADDDPALVEPVRLDAALALQAMQGLDQFDLPRTRGRPPEPDKRWMRAIDELKIILRGRPTLIALLKGHSFFRLAAEPGGTYFKVAIPESLREILAPVIGAARDDLRRLHGARLPALAALARLYHEFRRRSAYAGAAYRFPEIESGARLLPEQLQRDDLYFRLDGRVRHLLLDEFQDTSLSQFQFLWPLIGEIRDTGRLFFAVGDVKQSIYGWRGADRHLLNRLPGWLGAPAESLVQNYRSSPAVLTALDRLFARLDQCACLDPGAYDKEEHKKRAQIRRAAAAIFLADYRTPVVVAENAQRPGRVRLLITPAARGEPESDGALDEIGTIITAVQEHLKEDPDREIAVLCRRRKWIPALVAGLRQKGVEAGGEGGSAVADSAGVEFILSMLTWLDHPGHTLARAHVALGGMAEIFGLTAATRDTALLQRQKIEIMRGGLAPVVAGWVRHEAFRSRGTAHDQVRCEQLVELARHWDAAGGGRLGRFVERVRSQRLDNPISSRVRVMTIHGAKGLEFEAVIVADIQSEGRSASGGPRFLVTMTDPDAAPRVDLLPASDDAGWLGLEELLERDRQRQFEEDLSVLYVALTRAKSYLDVVVAASDKASPSLAGILREGWGHSEPGTHVIEASGPVVAAATSSRAGGEQKIGPDTGIWTAESGLPSVKFEPVPGRLAPVTPSGQEGAGVVKLGQILHLAKGAALERGTAVHALLAQIEWDDAFPDLEAWINSVPAREADRAACRLAARELHPKLLDATDALAKVFHAGSWRERWRGAGVARLDVWRERRFAVVLDRELMNGSFDRVVLGLDANGVPVRAAILDFKTDRIADEAGREERRRFYQPQIEAYVGALQRLTKLPREAITAELVWIGGD